MESSYPQNNETENIHTALSPNDAFAGILIVTMRTDEKIAEDETRYIHSTLSHMRLFEGWSNEQYQNMFDKLSDILEKYGLDGCMKMCAKALPSRFCATAFAQAVDLVLADGVVTEEEKDFLYDFQQILEIEDSLAKKILEVIIIKNRG